MYFRKRYLTVFVGCLLVAGALIWHVGGESGRHLAVGVLMAIPIVLAMNSPSINSAAIANPGLWRRAGWLTLIASIIMLLASAFAFPELAPEVLGGIFGVTMILAILAIQAPRFAARAAEFAADRERPWSEATLPSSSARTTFAQVTASFDLLRRERWAALRAMTPWLIGQVLTTLSLGLVLGLIASSTATGEDWRRLPLAFPISAISVAALFITSYIGPPLFAFAWVARLGREKGVSGASRKTLWSITWRWWLAVTAFVSVESRIRKVFAPLGDGTAGLITDFVTGLGLMAIVAALAPSSLAAVAKIFGDPDMSIVRSVEVVRRRGRGQLVAGLLLILGPYLLTRCLRHLVGASSMEKATTLEAVASFGQVLVINALELSTAAALVTLVAKTYFDVRDERTTASAA